MRDANLRAFHNTVRKLYNIEWEQLGFLTDVQKDNFFENPPMFFIRADDETATKLWDVMHPKAPEPVAGELRGNVIYPREWAAKQTDFEYDTGKPFPDMGGTAPNPAFTYIVNGVTGDVTARAG
ncbi:hypothetical protein [Bosea sp. AS-1]|uniref:hypothetical protein n=1 Tax=Bosea sp. AS-1 TaxID=2015316 RepID=UPI000B79405C|nr:hypothetical protein [Bosea sp. AS-1]